MIFLSGIACPRALLMPNLCATLRFSTAGLPKPARVRAVRELLIWSTARVRPSAGRDSSPLSTGMSKNVLRNVRKAPHRVGECSVLVRRAGPQTEVNAALSGAVNFGILLSGAGDRPSAPTA